MGGAGMPKSLMGDVEADFDFGGISVVGDELDPCLCSVP